MMFISLKKNIGLINDICINKADWKKYLETDSSIQVIHDNSEGSYLVYINNDEYAMWIDYKGCDLMTKNPNTEFLNKLKSRYQKH